MDICLVRMQVDTTLPLEQRRNYKNVFDALSRILKEEGIATLWRGYTGFALRVMSVTVTQLMVFQEIKTAMNKFRGNEEDDLTSRLVGVFVSGIFVPIAGLPWDNIKTKMQRMVPIEIIEAGSTKTQMPYKGFIDCLFKTVKREGFLGLWIGFPAFYMLAAPHTMISLMVQDYLTFYFGNNTK